MMIESFSLNSRSDHQCCNKKHSAGLALECVCE